MKKTQFFRKTTKTLASLLPQALLLHAFIAFAFITVDSFTPHISYAEDADSIKQEIEETKKDLEEKTSELNTVKAKADQISATLNKLSGDLNVTQGQVNQLQTQITELTEDIENLNKKLAIKKQDLDARVKVRNQTIRSLYIDNQRSVLELILEPRSLSDTAGSGAYSFSFVDNAEYLIGTLNKSISTYETDKNEVEEIKAQVEKQKKDMQTLAAKLAAQAAAVKNELSAVSQQKLALQSERDQISRKLSELSAKQAALLQNKTETFSTSVGDVPTTGDSASNPDYDPGFRKAFAAFSFGAPHRKGMSQYGAKGRAESGQDYKEILKAYYGDIKIEKADLPDSIRTDQGEFSLDGKYLKGLAEMPASWPMDALKAQAIAARTYAMSYVGWRTHNTNPSGKICTTESCQVWSASKASSSSAARWHQAVEETKGMIMLGEDTNQIFSAWYAASSGGYNYTYSSLNHDTRGGWDTKCGSRNCWTSDAYESIAGSPWFYKGWYKTRGNQSCGRKHPWLNEEEFADIIGALVLYEEDSDNQKHLSQVDAKSCWGENIDDTWSRDKVREKSGIEKVDDVSVSYSNGGVTAEVKVKTNKGELKFSGEDFKAIFNLRAPGAIHLKSLLFNIEVKD